MRPFGHKTFEKNKTFGNNFHRLHLETSGHLGASFPTTLKLPPCPFGYKALRHINFYLSLMHPIGYHLRQKGKLSPHSADLFAVLGATRIWVDSITGQIVPGGLDPELNLMHGD